MTDWNRCSDGLPRLGEIVAICCQDLLHVRHAFGYLVLRETSRSNSAVAEWVTVERESSIPLEFVTHWWRVPALPPEAKTWAASSIRPMRATADEWLRNEAQRPLVPRRPDEDLRIGNIAVVERIRRRVEYSSNLRRQIA